MKPKIILFAIFFTSLCPIFIHSQTVSIDTIIGAHVEFSIEDLPTLKVSGGFTNDDIFHKPYYDIFVSFGDGNSKLIERHFDNDQSASNRIFNFNDTIIKYDYAYCGNFNTVVTIMDRKHDPPPPSAVSPVSIFKTSVSIQGTNSECRDISSKGQKAQAKKTKDRIIDVSAKHSFLKENKIVEIIVSYKAESLGIIDLMYDPEFFTPLAQQLIKYPGYEQSKAFDLNSIQTPSNFPKLDSIPFDLNFNHLITIVDSNDVSEFNSSKEERRLFFYFECKLDSLSSTQIVADYIYLDKINGYLSGDNGFNLGNLFNNQYNKVVISALEPVDPNYLTMIIKDIKEKGNKYIVPFEFIFRNEGEGKSQGSLISLKKLDPLLFNINNDFELIKYGEENNTELNKINLSSINRIDKMKTSDIFIESRDLKLGINHEAKLTFTAEVYKDKFIDRIEDKASFFRACQVFIPDSIQNLKKLKSFPEVMKILNKHAVCVADSLICPSNGYLQSRGKYNYMLSSITATSTVPILSKYACFDEGNVTKCLSLWQRICNFFKKIF